MEAGHARRGEKSATPIITGPANMSNQRLMILAVGVLLVMGGLFALRFPVFLGDFDQMGLPNQLRQRIPEHVDAGRDRRLGGNPFRGSLPHSPSDASRRDHPAAGDRSAAISALLIRPRRQVLELPVGSGTSIDVTIPLAAPRREATKSVTNLKNRKGSHVQ
jgi:hypothetical protein